MNTYFKFLSKNKFYTFVTVFGFAISLMFVFLIAVYTRQELSVDKFQEKGDRIFILADESSIGAATRIAYRIEERYPEVEAVVPMITSHSNPETGTIHGTRIKIKTILAEKNFFDVFSFPLVQGSKDQVLEAKNGAVISETFARRAFPDKDPLGESIVFHDSVTVTVTGVMKDIKNSAIPYADVIFRIDNIEYFNSGLYSDAYHNAGGAIIAVLAKEGADLQAKTDDLLSYFKEIYWIYERGIYQTVRFIPFSEFYFAKIDASGMMNQGDKSFVLILISVGFVILLFAIFNYINLTVAQTGFRAREMATRLLVGASSGEPVRRLIVESVLLTFGSLLLGIFLAFLFVPFANDLLRTILDLAGFFSVGNIAIILFSTIILGIISGIFPSWFISRSKPIDVVRGTFALKNKLVFSKVFITIQNVITIALLVVSLVMSAQIDHLIHAPLGYNNKNIINIPNYGIGGPQVVQTLANELETLASVKRVALSQGTPFSRGNNYTFEYKEKNIGLQILTGDSTFFNMFGFEILHDNHTAETKKTYYNEQAYKELELDDDAITVPNIDLWFSNGISGKVKDFQLGDILSNTPPVAIVVNNRSDIYPWNLLVEVQGEPAIAYNQVKEVFEKMTNLDFEAMFMEEEVAKRFAPQRRVQKIVSIFTGIAMLISLLGLIAISTYFIRQREKEIAVKKVMGSTNYKITLKLVQSFLNYVLIAFVLATPISWYILNQWLADYSYCITLSPFYFIVGGLFCLVISALTVFYQSRKAANANPVKFLKNE